MDIIVKDCSEHFEVQLNDDAFPEVNIIDAGWTGKMSLFEDENLAADMPDQALWLIKGIEQRKNIILKIGEHILKTQKAFFAEGISLLCPSDIKLLSEDLNMHEAILMEALKGKYLQCRWGVFELSGFYSSAL